MKRLLIILLAAFLLPGCTNPRNPNHNPVQPQNISSETLLVEHNHHRQNRQWPLPALDPLEIDQQLEAYAQNHANWMASVDKLKHSDLGDVPGRWYRIGENIAWGQVSEKHVTNSWMKSPGHRANIMNDRFTNVGFGYAESADGRIYWCAVFGG